MLLASTSGGALSFLLACAIPTPSPNVPAPPQQAVVRIGVPAPQVVEGGNPEAAQVGFRQAWRLVTTDGLTTLGPDGRPRPEIAESWTESSDGLSWTIRIRPNVFFHDGTRCNAEAVRAALESALNRPNLGEGYPGLLDIRGLRTQGDFTLIVELTRPSAFLVDDLNFQITKRSSDGGSIGTGPYYPLHVSDQEVTLTAHGQYYLAAPAIDQVVFRSYPTLRHAWASLLRNEIDAVSNVPGDAQEFLASDTLSTFSFRRHYAYVMALNSNRPQLKDPAVRRALNAAINREAILESVLRGGGRPAFSPIWPDHWAYDKAVAGYSYDPALAKATLASRTSSISRGRSVHLTFTCLVPEGYGIFERMALVLQRQLYDIGVDLQLEAVTLEDLELRLRSGEFDAALLDLLSGPSLSSVYPFWRSPGAKPGLNVFSYRNAAADRWLDQLRFVGDEASVRAATSQLQRVMIEDPPALFIAWSERTGAVSKRLNVPPSTGGDPLYALSKWRFADDSSPDDVKP